MRKENVFRQTTKSGIGGTTREKLRNKPKTMLHRLSIPPKLPSSSGEGGARNGSIAWDLSPERSYKALLALKAEHDSSHADPFGAHMIVLSKRTLVFSYPYSNLHIHLTY